VEIVFKVDAALRQRAVGQQACWRNCGFVGAAYHAGKDGPARWACCEKVVLPRAYWRRGRGLAPVFLLDRLL